MSAPTLRRYHDGTGQRCALVFEARTRLHCVVIEDGGVRALDVPATEGRYMIALEGSVLRAARTMRRAGRRLGITRGAKRLLAEVAP